MRDGIKGVHGLTMSAKTPQAGRNSCSGSTPSRSSSRARRPSTRPAPLKPPLLYENGTLSLSLPSIHTNNNYFRHPSELSTLLSANYQRHSPTLTWSRQSIEQIDRIPLTQRIPTLFYDSEWSLLSSLLLYLTRPGHDCHPPYRAHQTHSSLPAQQMHL